MLAIWLTIIETLVGLASLLQSYKTVYYVNVLWKYTSNILGAPTKFIFIELIYWTRLNPLHSDLNTSIWKFGYYTSSKDCIID